MAKIEEELAPVTDLINEVRQRLAEIYAKQGKKYSYLMAVVQDGGNEDEALSCVANQIAGRADLLALVENILISAKGVVEGENDEEGIAFVHSMLAFFNFTVKRMRFEKELGETEKEEETVKKDYLQ